MPDTWLPSEVVLDFVVAALFVVLVAESRVEAIIPSLIEITLIGAESPFSGSMEVAVILFFILIPLLLSSVIPIMLKAAVAGKRQWGKLGD